MPTCVVAIVLKEVSLNDRRVEAPLYSASRAKNVERHLVNIFPLRKSLFDNHVIMLGRVYLTHDSICRLQLHAMRVLGLGRSHISQP